MTPQTITEYVTAGYHSPGRPNPHVPKSTAGRAWQVGAWLARRQHTEPVRALISKNDTVLIYFDRDRLPRLVTWQDDRPTWA